MSLYDELVKWRWSFPSWKLRFKILGILIVIALIFPRILETYQNLNNMHTKNVSQAMADISNNRGIITQGQSGGNNFTFNGPVSIYFYNSSGLITSPPSEQKIQLLSFVAVLNTFYEKFHDKLSEIFPFGYCIIGSSNKQIFIPENSPLSDNFHADWNSSHIINETNDTLEIALPDFIDKFNNRFSNNRELISNTPWKTSRGFSICDMGKGLKVMPLAKTDKGWIFVVGFLPC